MSRSGKEHHYEVEVIWTGNLGEGTSGYSSYSRNHLIQGVSKPTIEGSSDAAFRGDPVRWNPEELLVASLAACHKLWYLHLCAVAGIRVLQYRDYAEGLMAEQEEIGGRFIKVVLHPEVRIAAGCDPVVAANLHREAHRNCYVANSVNFAVEIVPQIS